MLLSIMQIFIYSKSQTSHNQSSFFYSRYTPLPLGASITEQQWLKRQKDKLSTMNTRGCHCSYLVDLMAHLQTNQTNESPQKKKNQTNESWKTQQQLGLYNFEDQTTNPCRFWYNVSSLQDQIIQIVSELELIMQVLRVQLRAQQHKLVGLVHFKPISYHSLLFNWLAIQMNHITFALIATANHGRISISMKPVAIRIPNWKDKVVD